MVYKYHVKHNGVVYPPGTEVPVEDNSKPVVTKETQEKPKAKPKGRGRRNGNDNNRR